jgi:hypothetical protein
MPTSAPGVTARRPIRLIRTIPIPTIAVLARLVVDAGTVIGVQPDASPQAGHRRLGIRFLGDMALAREVTVGYGPPMEEDDGTAVLPLWWEATEHPWLFPTFDGGLEVEETHDGTELRLVGSCRPPLGRLGAVADEIAGFRLARAALDAFLGEVADRLTAAG